MSSCDDGVRFYSVADSRYFVGVVGLVNSVRGAGHAAPFTVVDSGLTAEQRACLGAAGIDLVRPTEPVSGALAKGFGQLTRPSEIMVFLDADMVCVRHLGEIIEAAGRDGLAFIEDPPGRPQMSPELWETWAARLDLGELRPGPYLNSGLMVAAGSTGLAFHEELQRKLLLVDPAETFNARLPHVDASWPFYFADQDVVNPLAATERFRAKVAVLPPAEAPMPPFAGIRLVGGTCRYADGSAPLVLHHAWAKPWIEPLPLSPYTVLLRRALWRKDGPVEPAPELIPPAFRDGTRASARLAARSSRGSVRARLRGKLGIRRRLAARKSRRRTSAV